MIKEAEIYSEIAADIKLIHNDILYLYSPDTNSRFSTRSLPVLMS